MFKDLNNKYDNHAIKVVYLDYGVVGHVCNKWNLAMQKTEIADNIYDRIGNSVFGTVERITIYGFVVSTDFHGHYLMEWREKIWLYKQQVKSKWNSEKSSIIP